MLIRKICTNTCAKFVVLQYNNLMLNLAWCTDIHLDFLENDTPKFIKFCESLKNSNSDAILITGDISHKSSLIFQLSALEKIVQKQIYLVLGNHHFYGGSTEIVRNEMNTLCGISSYLKYLSGVAYIPLTPKTALVGHDGWYDAGYGNVGETPFIMNDWIKIFDFASHGVVNPISIRMGGYPNHHKIIEVSRRLAHAGVLHIMKGIKAASKYHNHIIVATHFPPFEEVCLHNGKASSPGSLPWYSSKMMGDMLRQAASFYPQITFDVYSGHSHGKADAIISQNLSCHVGGAEYNQPQLQNVIVVQ